MWALMDRTVGGKGFTFIYLWTCRVVLSVKRERRRVLLVVDIMWNMTELKSSTCRHEYLGHEFICIFPEKLGLN